MHYIKNGWMNVRLTLLNKVVSVEQRKNVLKMQETIKHKKNGQKIVLQFINMLIAKNGWMNVRLK